VNPCRPEKYLKFSSEFKFFSNSTSDHDLTTLEMQQK